MTTGMPRFIRMSRTQTAMTFVLGLVIVFPSIACSSLVNVAEAHPPSEAPSVRVSALKGDDGAVRISVQVLGADGQWSERLLPTRRVVSAAAPTDIWLRSSPVRVAGGDGELAPLFCVVAHGAPDDRFWVKFRAHLFQSAALTGTNLRFEIHPDGEAQSAAIERCLADGADVIASTLASPGDVREPLMNARAAGIRVVTFNVGTEHAESVGSQVHIAFNDRAAGQQVGRLLNRRGNRGQVGCLVREVENLSFQRRCDGLESVYQGAGVTRIQLDEHASPRYRDHADYVQTIASELVDDDGPRYDAVLALDADTLRDTLAAVQTLGDAAAGLRLAAVGEDLEDLAAFPEGLIELHLDAMVGDSVETLGFFVVSAMHLTYYLPLAPHIAQPELWLVDPSVDNHQIAREHAGVPEATSTSLEPLIASSETYEREDNSARLRVAALKRSDGAIVIAIESMAADGSWSPLQLPQRRVIAADAPSGIWLVSSQVELPSPDAEGGALFCVVAHGSVQDRYWRSARAFMHIAAHLGDTSYRFESHLDGADQAAAIDQCSADGAEVIASTLADPEAVTNSLLAAKRAGARIVTFNSGARFAADAGSEIHVAMNDRETAVAAARRINELGVTGPIACVIHEQGNVGLEDRCAELEATYSGVSVSRLQLTEGTTAAQIISDFIARLTEPQLAEVELLMVLSADVLLNALDALDQIYADSGRVIKTVPIGLHHDLAARPVETRNRHLFSPFNDSVESQGFFVVSAMQFVHNRYVPPELTSSPEIWLATPFALNPTSIRDPDAGRLVAETFDRYAEEAARDDE